VRVDVDGCHAALVTEIPVIWDVAVKLLQPLHDEFVALAVRAPEGSPVMNLLEQFLDGLKERRQEEIQGIVSRRASEEIFLS